MGDMVHELMTRHMFTSCLPLLSQWHFNTDARRLLFDSYAEDVLVKAGMHWWDVFGACTMGEYRPHDIVHTDGTSVMAQNRDMFDLFACHKT